MKNLYEVIRRPLITEKSTVLKEVQHTLCFEVHRSATKPEIKKAVESLFSVKGFEGETTERTRAAMAATNRMMELEGVLLKLPEGPRVKTTVFNVCVMDYEVLRTMPEPQLAWLKRGLTELHWHLGLSREREAV